MSDRVALINIGYLDHRSKIREISTISRDSFFQPLAFFRGSRIRQSGYLSLIFSVASVPSNFLLPCRVPKLNWDPRHAPFSTNTVIKNQYIAVVVFLDNRVFRGAWLFNRRLGVHLGFFPILILKMIRPYNCRNLSIHRVLQSRAYYASVRPTGRIYAR